MASDNSTGAFEAASVSYQLLSCPVLSNALDFGANNECILNYKNLFK